jgi:hypothetical protein
MRSQTAAQANSYGNINYLSMYSGITSAGWWKKGKSGRITISRWKWRFRIIIKSSTFILFSCRLLLLLLLIKCISCSVEIAIWYTICYKLGIAYVISLENFCQLNHISSDSLILFT